MKLFQRAAELDPDTRARIKRRNRNRRIVVYGGLVGLFWAFYVWQPWELDLIPRKPNPPLPMIDPDSKRLFAKGTKVLIVTAHPDDSEFYVGGTLHLLSNTAEIHQIITTDGDKSYYGPLTNAAENRRIRRQEADEARKAWNGKSLTFFGYPDGRLRVSAELVDRLVEEIRRIRPDYILGFDGEYRPRFSHQDHRRTGEATLQAAMKAGVPCWLMMFATSGPNYVVDITDAWDRKAELLAIHRSQFFGERLKGVTNMVAGTAEGAGEKIGVALGEAFRCIRIGN